MKARLLLTLNTFLAVMFMAGCASNQSIESKAAIATSHPLATQAGFRALDQGGNAFDAAIAAASVLSVVTPYNAGLGGGSVWLLQNKKGSTTLIDARAQPPSNSDSTSLSDNSSSLNNPLSAGIPGQAAAYSHISEKYGIRPLAANLSDAVRIAEQGFRINKQYTVYAAERLEDLKLNNAYPFVNNKHLPAKGSILKQPELATTLMRLGRKGHDGFYQGFTARKILADVNNAGGNWIEADLNNYKVVERLPVVFEYEDTVITTTISYPGLHLQQVLNIFERFDSSDMSQIEIDDLLAQILHIVIADNNRWLGADERPENTLKQLTSDSHLSHLARQIELDRSAAAPSLTSSHQTNNEALLPHMTILDKWGNKVSASFSMNMPFGSAFNSSSTGVLLNNSLASGQWSLSNMTPTIIEDDQSLAIIGVSSEENTSHTLLLSILDYIQKKPLNQWGQSSHSQINNNRHAITPTTNSRTDTQLILLNKESGQVEATSGSGRGQAIIRYQAVPIKQAFLYWLMNTV